MTITGTHARTDGVADRALLPGSAQLTAHGLVELRRAASRIVAAGLAAVDPRAGMARHVRLDGTELVVGSRSYDLAAVRNIYVLGAGKATMPIAEGLAELLGERLTGGLVVVQRGAARPIAGLDVRESDHPTPGEASRTAAAALLELAESAGADDLVIACFTGGSSALASLPPAGVSFAAKQELHRLLLASGAPIEQINAVRKHVSAIKGGRLARAAAPARIVNLTLPDVASGRLDCITDPTVSDESTVAEALSVLRSRGLWDRVDPSIRAYLDGSPTAVSPNLDDVDIHTVLLADGEDACAAMSAVAVELGLRPYVFGTRIEGEAHTLGGLLGTVARESVTRQRPFAAPCVLLGAGGESVVTLSGRPDFAAAVGGPNQETALAFAQALGAVGGTAPVAAVFIDSDGSDGGTPHAGAIVDGCTPARAVAAGIDLNHAIAFHESSAALRALEDLISTGPTGTNISDLWAVVIGSPVDGSPVIGGPLDESSVTETSVTDRRGTIA